MQKHLLIDTDIHPVMEPQWVAGYLPEPWHTRYLSGNRTAGNLGYWNPNGVNRVDAVMEDGSRIERSPQAMACHLLDKYEIDYGILNCGEVLHVGLSPEPDYAIALIQALNDTLINHWLPADTRYRASIAVYPHDPEAAVREIHRLGSHPAVVQVILPSASPRPYGQRFFHPIYAAAAEHSLPVAIHPGSEGVGISGPPTVAGYPTSYFEWHTNLVCSYITHLVSMVAEGVFIKFPTLKFVLLEGGVSWLPPILWRFDKNWKALRATTPWLNRPPSAIIQEHVRLSTQPIEEPEQKSHLHHILEMFDAGNMLMFATDYPHWDGDTPDFTARAYPSPLRARIMGENARQLYHLPVAEQAG
jgi:uncharacterized protein